MGDWVWFCFEAYSREDLILISYGARWIWFARNSLVHKAVYLTVEEAVARVKTLVNEISSPIYRFIVSREEASQVWMPPKQGEFKINCDDAWCLDGSSAGVGIIGRDHKGLVLFAKALPLTMVHCSLEVEGRAILLAMQEAQRRGWSRVTFSSVNAEACLMLMGKEDKHHTADDWSTSCRKYFNVFTSWRIEHVLREGNMVADTLAVKASKESWLWSSGEAIPRCISQAVLKDLLLLPQS